ncbi:hypothetical protein [Streptomyces sp. NPDC005141]
MTAEPVAAKDDPGGISMVAAVIAPQLRQPGRTTARTSTPRPQPVG